MPPSMDSFPQEVREAFFLHQMLSDKWEGMSGYHLGKDMSALSTYLDLYEIKNPKQTMYFFKHIENEHSQLINEKIKKQQEAQKNRVGKGK